MCSALGFVLQTEGFRWVVRGGLLGGGVGLGVLAGGETDFAGGAVELPAGEGQGEKDDAPDGDEDGGGPPGGEVVPEVEEGAAVADADTDRDDVAGEPAKGEGGQEFFARHADGSGGEDEGAERHGRREDCRERDGEDGVGFHPGGDAGEDGGGDVLFQEGHASGLTGGVGEEASDGRAEGGDGDEEDGVGVGGGVEDEHDVGDAGEGEGDEGAVDDGDEEEADEAEVQEEVHEAVMRGVGRGLRGGGEREESGEWRERDAHAGEYDVSWWGRVAGKKFWASLKQKQIPCGDDKQKG
jgi:hypothetical protein